jgi:hypothetical protein
MPATAESFTRSTPKKICEPALFGEQENPAAIEACRMLLAEDALTGRVSRFGRWVSEWWFRAASWGDLLQVQRLIAAGRPIDVRNSFGQTALHLAVWKCAFVVVKLLLDAGANVDAKDKFRETALHRAVRYNQMNSVCVLIAHGADVNAKDEDGITPLCSAQLCNHPKIAAFLREIGARE